MYHFTKKDLLLYAVTDQAWLCGSTLAEQVRMALDGGVTCIQLREKSMAYDKVLREALEIRAITEQYHVPFLIDDYADIAKECGADGVHIGPSDMDIKAAQDFLTDGSIIGATARTVEQALAAAEKGADYLGSGAAFVTTTKKDAIPMSEDTMKEICKGVDIPVVAIGGITYENMEQLAGRGIAGIAVVSSLFSAKDIYAQAVRMRRLAEQIFLS